MSNTQMLFKRAAGAALAALLLLTLFCAVPGFAARAEESQTPKFTKDLPATASLSNGGAVWLSVAASTASGGGITYQWYKDGTVISGATHDSLTATSAGKYYVIAANAAAPTITAQSVTCDVTSGSQQPAAGGSLYVTGYTVLDAAGNEVQKVTPGEKCQIVVSLKDGRFSEVPSATDGYGNIVNIKLTSTASFASPSFGDIKQTTPGIEGGELKYAVIFNDITYLGGENALAFDVSYVQDQVAMQSVSCGISQCQTESQQANSAKPMVMVKDSNYGGENIAAGQTFTLTLTSYNTSKSAEITDVKTTLTLPASLTLASGSNTVLTDSVGAGGTYTTTFTLQAQSSAETGVANLTVDYQYYLKGTDTQLSSSQMITVPLVQPDRFSFTSVDVPTEAYVGEETSITLNYVNKGKGILYNLSSAIVTDAGMATAVDPYLGNLNSGTEGSADFTVVADQAGTISGTITLTYEDVNGAEKTQTKEFSVTISEAPTYEDPYGNMDIPTDVDMPQQGMPVWGWVLIGLGAAAVVVATIIVIRKKKAKRRAALLAEDDDDEDF